MECTDLTRCAHCGDDTGGDDTYDVDGVTLCVDCWLCRDCREPICPDCSYTYTVSDETDLIVDPESPEEEAIAEEGSGTLISLCDECARSRGLPVVEHTGHRVPA